MFYWFYLLNISCENINLMGINVYLVVFMEIKFREEEICILNLFMYSWVVIGILGVK